jgi:hypothetical protein
MIPMDTRWLAAAAFTTAFGLSCGLAGPTTADAQDVGMVRISDRSASARSAMGSASGVQAIPTGHRHYAHGQMMTSTLPGDASGQYCDNCDGRGGRHGGNAWRMHLPPDHGYSVPAKSPLQRRGVEYENYFPPQWYGAGLTYQQNYPMVYMPTDTTQLGFYSQHVPFWRPNPNMLPPRPIPSQWHIHAPVVYSTDFHRMHAGAGNSFQGGYVIDSTTAPTTNGASPTPIDGGGLQPVPAPQGIPQAPGSEVPPAPVLDSAASGHIKRASGQQ